MNEKIRREGGGQSGWQRLARESYRRMTGAKKPDELPKAGTSPVNRDEMLDEVEARGRKIREHSGSVSGPQLTGGIGIGGDDEDSDALRVRAARRIMNDPPQDRLSE